MAAVFFGMIVVAGLGVAVATSLVRYAQRHWVTGRPAVVHHASRGSFSRPLGDVAGFGEQLRPGTARYRQV